MNVHDKDPGRAAGPDSISDISLQDVLVLGGGYSGLWGAVNAMDVARECNRPLTVTLVSADDFLAHRPRLYERDPESLRVPLRPLLDPLGIGFIQGRAVAIDADASTAMVETAQGAIRIRFRRLLLATGSQLRELPVPGVADFAFNVDSFAGAVAFDRHLQKLVAGPYDEAARSFVIVGAGMTGIELAAELRDRIAAHGSLEQAEAARIVLTEKGAKVGPTFGDSPRPVIERALRDARVELHLGASLARMDAQRAVLDSGEEIPTRTVVIAVGMRASPLTEQIAGTRDAAGRLHVDRFLRVEGVDNVFASGDVAHAYVDDGQVALMACQNSRTMGKYAGRNVAADLLGVPFTPYRQADYTTCLDLGRSGAVYTEGFERELKADGAKAKERKRVVNTQLIYPPAPGRDEDILAAMRIDRFGR